MNPNDLVPQHSSRAACEASSLKFEDFKNWVLRDRQAVVPLSKRERAKGRIALTTRTVIHLALIRRLVDLGLKSSEAAQIAAAYSYVGSGGVAVRREPGTLFPTGKTVLLIRAGLNTKVLNIEPANESADKVLALCVGGIALDLNAIDAEVRARLSAWEEQKQKAKTEPQAA